MTAFLKMHGLGNDFAVFDARGGALALDAARARAIADRRRGIGCDQVIVIEKGANGADAFMRIFNADGGEVESCGNAARCVAHLLMEQAGAGRIVLDTIGGVIVCEGAGDLVTVDMGAPKLDWRDIPLVSETDTIRFALDAEGQTFDAGAVNVGNPHCVLFVEDAEKAPVETLGARLERHPMFPARTNVEFVEVVSRTRLRVCVWERGAGRTLACGTGACAAMVAARRRDFVDDRVEVLLDGGPLAIAWKGGAASVFMTGPWSLSYRGEVDLGALEIT